MKDEHVSLPKPKSQLTQLHDDDEDVFVTSLIDRYAARLVSLQNIHLATFAVSYDVIQSSTKTGETEHGNTEEEMQNAENSHSLTKMKLQKGLGIIRKRKQEAILCTRRYKNPCRTRKIWPCKASPLLPMESLGWHNINIQKISWLIHKQAANHTLECTKFQWRLCSIWHRPSRFGKQYTTVCMGRWLLQILHRMIEQQMSKVSTHFKNEEQEKKIAQMQWVMTTPEIHQIHYVCCMQKQQKAGYEFSQLLHTCMQLEHRSMSYSNVQ